MSGQDDHRGPDDGRAPDDVDLDAVDRALGARLASVLAGRADALVVADVPFDADRRSTLDPIDEGGPSLRLAPPRSIDAVADPPHRGDGGADDLPPLPITSSEPARRGWLVWVAGAAAAVVLVAAIVMINAVRQPSLRTGDDPSPLIGPEAAWAPTWVPDGLELWSLDTTVGDPATLLSGGSGTNAARPTPTVQLLESATTDARMLIGIDTIDSRSVGTGEPMVVRGIEAVSAPEQAMGPGSPAGTRFEWQEGDRAFGAFVVGADPATAVALLDDLSLADPADPSKGFAGPADGSWTLRTDDPSDAPAAPVVGASFGYDRSRPTGEPLALEVVTVSASSSAAGFPGYLTTGFLGSIRDDGVAVAFVAGADGRPATSYVVWPDGRTVYSSGADLDEATAARIAEGVEPITRQELEARADAVSTKLGTGDVLASADLPSGKVEVIGSPGASAICLTASNRRTCKGTDAVVGSSIESLPLLGSVVIDGTWYVFGASDLGAVELGIGRSGSSVTVGTAMAVPVDPDDLPRTGVDLAVPTTGAAGGAPTGSTLPVATVDVGPTTTVASTSAEVVDPGTSPGTGPANRSVPFESAVVGPWTLALLVVPADVGAGWAAFPGQSMSFPRPSP